MTAATGTLGPDEVIGVHQRVVEYLDALFSRGCTRWRLNELEIASRLLKEGMMPRVTARMSAPDEDDVTSTSILA